MRIYIACQARQGEKMDELKTWHGWKVAGVIGKGSYGTVYRIEREAFGRTYSSALKVITIPNDKSEYDTLISTGMSEEDVKAYFHDMARSISNEFALMSELKGNSNIVSFEDYEVEPLEDGYSWRISIRMELLEPFVKVLKDHRIDADEVVRLGIDMCNALELCEQKNIIHRDIKPENIFLSPQGTYKLGDFGIARELERASAGLSKKGTYSYMAPEVYRGENYGPNVDIYSLGMVLYRLMNNNRLPFMPEYPAKIRFADTEKANARRMSGEKIPLPANADRELGEIILSACEFDPGKRYRKAADLRKDLKAYSAGRYKPVKTAPSLIEETGEIDEEATVFYPVAPVDDMKQEAVPAVVGTAVISETEATPGTASASEDIKDTKESSTDDPVKPIQKKEKKAKGEKKNHNSKLILGAAAAVILILLAIFAVIRLESGVTIDEMTYKSSETTYVSFGEADEITAEDIVKLDKLKNLQEVRFDSMELDNDMIKAIGSLRTGITKLTISNCTGFTDISPLSEMSGVQELILKNDSITDEMLGNSGLGGMKSLAALNLSRNEGLSSLEPLKEMLPKCMGLSISCTNISDITALKDAKKLYALSAAHNGISDISMIDGKELLYINLDGNNISDISPVKNWKKLTHLMLSGNKISDISPVAGLELLEDLEISGNEITDLTPLSGHSSLVTLYVNDNRITSLKGLEHELALANLAAADNELADLDGIANCTVLKSVYLDNTGITDLSVLKKSAETLEWISVNGDDIGSLDVMRDMPNLTDVYADDTGIDSIDALAGCMNLETLSAERNSISSLEALRGHDALMNLFMKSNKIGDMSVMEDMQFANSESSSAGIDLADNDIRRLIVKTGTSGFYYNLIGNPVEQSIESGDNNYCIRMFGISYYDGIAELADMMGGNTLYLDGCPLDKQLGVSESLPSMNVVFDSAREGAEKEMAEYKDSVRRNISYSTYAYSTSYKEKSLDADEQVLDFIL